jgi:uncharacterized membrane protein YkvA (DUF1232 family)
MERKNTMLPIKKFSIQGLTVNGEWDEGSGMLLISELDGSLGLEGKFLGFGADIRGAIDVAMDNYIRIKVQSIGKLPKFTIPGVLNLVRTFNSRFAEAAMVKGDVILIDPNRLIPGSLGGQAQNGLRVLVQPKTFEVAEEAVGSFRERFLAWTEKNAGTMVKEMVDILFTIPDLLILLINLAKDPRIAPELKLKIALCVAYVLSPIDLIPEIVAGALGFLDDVAAMGLLVAKLVCEISPEIIRENWKGRPDVLEWIIQGHALTQALANLSGKLPDVILKKLVLLFGKREDEAAAAGERE